jgi:hypothetical protein
MVIKSILKEELANSLRMKKRYDQELAKLPRGSLVKRNIKGHEYYYLVASVKKFYERMRANIQYPTLKSNDQGDSILLPNLESWTFRVGMKDWIDQVGRLSVTEKSQHCSRYVAHIEPRSTSYRPEREEQAQKANAGWSAFQ